jgi:photosystem II stability/assembly factor-like uncharacterized protein
MRGFTTSLVLLFLLCAAPLLAVEGQWQILGPDGGPVNDLAFQPGSSQVLYAAVDGGVYKSRDAGASWASTGSGLDARSATLSVAVDPVRPQTVYAAQSGGIFRSIEGGQVWSLTKVRSAYQVAVHPRSSGAVFAATVTGLYRTADGGATWSRLTQGLPKSYSATLIAFDPLSERRLYAWVQTQFDAPVGKIYRSTDGGASWQALRRGPQANQRIFAFAVDPLHRGTLYAGTNLALYKSVDDGISWQPAGVPGFIATLKIDPRLGTVYAGTLTGLFRSEDGGAVWRRLFQGLEGSSVAALAFSPSSAQTLYAGLNTLQERGGVFKSVNGGVTWTFSGRGISALFVESIAVDPHDADTLWITGNDVPFKSTDRGATWTRVRPGPAGGDGRATQVALDPVDGSTVYLELPDGTVRRSQDGGATWAAAGHPGTSAFGNARLAVDPSQPATLYAAGVGIAKSTDAGGAWRTLPVTPASSPLPVFSDFDVAPSSPSTLYGSGRGDAGGPLVVRSLDGGATWTNIQQDLPPGPHTEAVYLAVDPQAATTVYSLIDGSVFKTVDGGESWSLFNDAFQEQTVTTLAISPVTSGLLYTGAWFENVYQLQDGDGGGWEPLGTSPRQEVYVTLAADPNDPCRIYAGTGSHGLLAFTRSGTAQCR